MAMKVFLVYAHPSDKSFTRHARDRFIAGLVDAGHEYIVSDLYRMNFVTDMSETEYLREANYRSDETVPHDVQEEQKKINASDAIAFIYPVFWTEAPAKLVGWFDRVWTYGFAYGERKMKRLEKGLVLCIAGHSVEKLAEYGHLDSMKTVMLGDRLYDRVKQKKFIVLDGMTAQDAALRESNRNRHLETSYRLGRDF
jgi:NAD(P)H dehydrogenase (quinone)